MKGPQQARVFEHLVPAGGAASEVNRPGRCGSLGFTFEDSSLVPLPGRALLPNPPRWEQETLQTLATRDRFTLATTLELPSLPHLAGPISWNLCPKVLLPLLLLSHFCHRHKERAQGREGFPRAGP